MGPRKVVFGSDFTFCGWFFEFLWHPGKVIFSCFCIIGLLSRGTPGGVRSRFGRVLSSLLSKRICTQGSFSLGPGAGGHRLGPHGGLLKLRKGVFGSQFTFLVSILEFWWHPQKSIFSVFFGHFWRLPGVSPELLGCQIWRLFEHFGSIFWPVRDLITSLHWLAYRRCCKMITRVMICV